MGEADDDEGYDDNVVRGRGPNQMEAALGGNAD